MRLMIALSGDLSLDAKDRCNLLHPAVGGVILFARNFANAMQLRQLTADIRRVAGRFLLIAADQEGGRVQRFCGGGFAPLPAAAKLQSENAAFAAGVVAAAELLAAGVDLTFAPVLDLASGRSRIIGDRAFAKDAKTAATLAAAFADGIAAAGMQCCGKHFPGHGYARADSHKTLPTDEREFADIAAADLIPFARLSSLPAMMTAHIVFSNCDGKAATFSRFWLQKILRGRLKFRGMIIGDDLAMAGADIGDIGARMRAATAAGCEGLLVCQPQLVAEALAAANDFAAGEIASADNVAMANPWHKLAPQPDGRISTGDPAYQKARARLQLIS